MVEFDKLIQSLTQPFTKRRLKVASLEPDDFPVSADGSKLVKSDGKPVAVAKDTATAVEIADRLNEDAQRKEEDKWSA